VATPQRTTEVEERESLLRGLAAPAEAARPERPEPRRGRRAD
jgi:hypothetical protein